ncbi:MAG: hypothetical protein ACR2PL_00135, partial [Dehalococcoidia bacterium]
WHSMRPPRGVAVALWAGVQSVELVSVGNDYVQVACGSEGEYRSAGGRREQVSSALDAAMRLAARLIEMLLYDIPEVKLARVRLDVYSTFTVDGLPEQRCILSTVAARQVANELPWEDMSPREIIDRFQSRYATDARGAVIPIEPDPPLPDELAPADSPVSGAERRSSGKDSRPAGRRRAERRSTR